MNIKQLLVGRSIRLRYVHRYSTCRTIHKESVAEHAYYTMLYSRILGWWIEEEYGSTIDYAKLLFKGLIHDMEECITGDIPRDFKHSTKEMNETIEIYAGTMFLKVVQEILEDSQEAARWHYAWLNAKDDTLEGKIIAFADFLSVIGYVYEETWMTSSISLRENIESLRDYYELFDHEKFSLFRPLVVQVRDILYGEIFNGSK